MWQVYILLCSDGSLYTGYTNDLTKRLYNHQTGKGGAYTRSHIPLKVIFREEFITKSEALKREAEIKKWKRGTKISNLNLKF